MSALPSRALRVALIHDWLTGTRGGERCLEVFCEIFPDADIFTLVHDPGSVSPAIERHRIFRSPLERLPRARTRYRHYLPLLPWAVSHLKPRGYDLILSSSHCVAKAVSTGGTPHICYCHTPMRYVWDRFDDYFGRGRPLLQRLGGRLLRSRLQAWDTASNDEVHRFLANSRYVAQRIERFWGRKAAVVYPPVDVDRFGSAGAAQDYYLIVSALAPYKRIDLALEAFRKHSGRLLVVGQGPDERRLRALAPSNVAFLGWQPDARIAELMRSCRALLLPGTEDFGITPLEAMASGRPVVALAEGGALETVVDVDATGDASPTGVLFHEPTPDALLSGLSKLESRLCRIRPEALRRHAMRFSRRRFREEIVREISTFSAEFV